MRFLIWVVVLILLYRLVVAMMRRNGGNGHRSGRVDENRSREERVPPRRTRAVDYDNVKEVRYRDLE